MMIILQPQILNKLNVMKSVVKKLHRSVLTAHLIVLHAINQFKFRYFHYNYLVLILARFHSIKVGPVFKDKQLHIKVVFYFQINSTNGVTRHPLLGVGICMTCRKFYKDGSGWEKDEDGCDIYCRWCGQGGELFLCDKCPAAFCKR